VVSEQLDSASLYFGKVKLMESFKLQIYIFLRGSVSIILRTPYYPPQIP